MEKDKLPNPNTIHPVKNHYDVIYAKNINNNKKVSIGDFTYISESNFKNNILGCYDWIQDKLIIGKYCQIGKDVKFLLNGVNHEMDCISTYPFYIFEDWNQPRPENDAFKLKGDIIIGNDVWIGQGSSILPGVKIGNGAIIGYNSVVSKDIPSYAIAAGNPCKVIKYRFDKQTIKELEELRWWDLPIDKVKLIANNLKSADIKKSITKIKKLINNIDK